MAVTDDAWDFERSHQRSLERTRKRGYRPGVYREALAMAAIMDEEPMAVYRSLLRESRERTRRAV